MRCEEAGLTRNRRQRGVGLCVAAGAAFLFAGCGQSHETIEPWPFTVDKVTLSCEPVAGRLQTGKVFVTTAEGKRYAVNGVAAADVPLMRDIQKEVDLRPLIERGLALCDGPARRVLLLAPLTPRQSNAPAPARYTIEPDELDRHGIIATMESEQVIEGKRPTFALACKAGVAPTVLFDLIDAPNTPPPLRGVFAEFQFGEQTRRLEMSWGAEGRWMLRSGDSRAMDREFAKAALNAGSVTLHGDGAYMPADPINWDLGGFRTELERLSSMCS